jgi:hypothetical protein
MSLVFQGIASLKTKVLHGWRWADPTRCPQNARAPGRFEKYYQPRGPKASVLRTRGAVAGVTAPLCVLAGLAASADAGLGLLARLDRRRDGVDLLVERLGVAVLADGVLAALVTHGTRPGVGAPVLRRLVRAEEDDHLQLERDALRLLVVTTTPLHQHGVEDEGVDRAGVILDGGLGGDSCSGQGRCLSLVPSAFWRRSSLYFNTNAKHCQY